MNLARIIDDHAADRPAFRFRSETVSYGQLRERSAELRRALAANDVGPGDRVALVLGTTPAFAVAYLGALGTGAVAVPLNPHSPLAEIEREFGDVSPSVVVTDAGGADHDPGAVQPEALESLGVPVIRLEAFGALAAPLADEVGEAPAIVERNGDDVAALLFTSGTAGAPKAAILTHGSLLANIEQIEMRVGLAQTAEDVGVLALPPFHILGLNAVLGVQLFAGGTLALLERFDPVVMLRVIAEERVTVLAGVPQMFDALVSAAEARGDELSHVRLACSGGAPLSESVAQRFEARFKIPIWQGYGLTEASPTVTFPDLSSRHDPSSVGIPLPGVEVRVVDADGAEVEQGDPGEVLVRGPNVFAGYYEDADATRAAIDRGGWLHTGDVAVLGEDGSLTLVDRSKDLIIVSGFNVFPAEVEQVLTNHPAVAEAAVVGVPDPAHGEAVRAFVVPTEESWPADAAEPVGVSADELSSWCGKYLARYKCPASLTFVRELPRGLQGKVLRRAIA